MEGELYTFAQVWVAVLVSLCYCNLIVAKTTVPGFTRLLLTLPVVALFLSLPLLLSSIYLGPITAFFVAWLANFKLLLFAFGHGPLCADPSVSLPRFLALACLPIKTRQNLDLKSDQNDLRSPKSSFNYAIKVLLMAVMFQVYEYNDQIHRRVVLFLYSFHIYFFLEIVQVVVGAVTRTVLGIEFERQFNEPYLATSLQDFWGRRWNLTVTSIMRPTVYEPVLGVASRAVGRRWAALPAVMATFAASGVMHELIFYYMGRVRPTWEITWFFLLHGGCLVAEIAGKKVVGGRFRLPAVVSGPLTFGFVVVSGFWLFLPQLVRCGAFERGLEETAVVGAWVRGCGSHLLEETAVVGAWVRGCGAHLFK